MPNMNAFGNINNPMVTADIAGNGSLDGVLYYSTTSSQTIVTNGFLAFQLSNPTTANRTARIARVFAGAQAITSEFYVRNGTLTGGVTLSAFNGNFSFTDRSQMIPSFSISTINPVTGGATLSSVLQAAGPPVINETGRIIVPPGSRFIVSLQNLATASSLSISVSWIEH